MMEATEVRGVRKVREGVVIGDAMEKTRVVQIERRVRHRLYGKVLKRTSKIYVHDEKNESGMGDTVKVVETRPLSKLKCWRLLEVVKKA
jgi:small subunit ribosomal protein S17